MFITFIVIVMLQQLFLYAMTTYTSMCVQNNCTLFSSIWTDRHTDNNCYVPHLLKQQMNCEQQRCPWVHVHVYIHTYLLTCTSTLFSSFCYCSGHSLCPGPPPGDAVPVHPLLGSPSPGVVGPAVAVAGKTKLPPQAPWNYQVPTCCNLQEYLPQPSVWFEVSALLRTLAQRIKQRRRQRATIEQNSFQTCAVNVDADMWRQNWRPFS